MDDLQYKPKPFSITVSNTLNAYELASYLIKYTVVWKNDGLGVWTNNGTNICRGGDDLVGGSSTTVTGAISVSSDIALKGTLSVVIYSYLSYGRGIPASMGSKTSTLSYYFNNSTVPTNNAQKYTNTVDNLSPTNGDDPRLCNWSVSIQSMSWKAA